jgi:hypothetical protein
LSGDDSGFFISRHCGAISNAGRDKAQGCEQRVIEEARPHFPARAYRNLADNKTGLAPLPKTICLAWTASVNLSPLRRI